MPLVWCYIDTKLGSFCQVNRKFTYGQSPATLAIKGAFMSWFNLSILLKLQKRLESFWLSLFIWSQTDSNIGHQCFPFFSRCLDARKVQHICLNVTAEWSLTIDFSFHCCSNFSALMCSQMPTRKSHIIHALCTFYLLFSMLANISWLEPHVSRNTRRSSHNCYDYLRAYSLLSQNYCCRWEAHHTGPSISVT